MDKDNSQRRIADGNVTRSGQAQGRKLEPNSPKAGGSASFSPALYAFYANLDQVLLNQAHGNRRTPTGNRAAAAPTTATTAATAATGTGGDVHDMGINIALV